MLVCDPNTGNIYVVNVSETHPSTKRYIYIFFALAKLALVSQQRDAAAAR